MTYVITSPCIDLKSKACVEECPVDCIYEGARTMYIHPDECVSCGACEAVCPVEAIHHVDDVPSDQLLFITAAHEFAAGLPEAGGASRVGPQSFDAPGLFDHPPTPPDLPHADVLGDLTSGSEQREPVALVYPEPSVSADLEALCLFYRRVVVLCNDARKAFSGSPRIASLVDEGALLLAESDLWVGGIGSHLLPMVRYIVALDKVEREGAMGGRGWDGPPGTLFVRLQEAAFAAGSEFTLLDWMPSVRSVTKVLLPHLIRLVAAGRGLSLHHVCFDTRYMRSLGALSGTAGTYPSSWWDFEPVAPDTSLVPIDDYLSFRRANLGRFRAHINLLTSVMPATATTGIDWLNRRDAIAESAHHLRAVASGLDAGGMKHWLMGGFGDFATLHPPGAAPGIARAALATGSTTGKPDVFALCMTLFDGSLHRGLPRGSRRVG